MIYHVFANRSNIGDWLSAKGIQKLLAPLEITELLCDAPFVKTTIRHLSQATEKDLIIIGGGGLFMDYFVPFWEAFKPISERVPLCIWGIGCCDIKNEPSLPPRRLIEDIVNNSKLCIVRDNLTRSFLENCQIPSAVPCPSINMIEPVSEKGRDVLHVVNYSTAGVEAYEAMCSAGQKFAKNTTRVYRETNNLISKGSDEGLARTLSLYERSDVVLSSALHGCIIGVAMGLKVLAVSGDRKIEGFMESVGQQDRVLDVSKLKRLPELLNEIHLQDNLEPVLEDIRKENREVAGTIKSFLS